MRLGDWSAEGHGTLVRRLARALRREIANGSIPAHTVLPSERALATELSVSRPTVTAALDELRGEGLLLSRQGSGTRVAAFEIAAPGPTLVERALGAAAVNLAAPVPQSLPQIDGLAVSTADLQAVLPAHGYDPVGLPALRSAVAERWRSQGVPADTGRTLITNGAHHGLAIAVGRLTRPGDRVLVERHTFGGVLDLLDDRGVTAVAVDRDDEGVDPADLDRRLATERPSAVVLMPTVHSPTGRATTARRVSEIAEVLDRRGTTVIADDALADLCHGERPPGLAGRCERATIVTVTSLSKSIWGGFRVGWLTAPRPVFDDLARQRARRDLGTSIASQLLTLQVLPHLDRLLSERVDLLASNGRRAAKELRRRFPDWTVHRPDGAAMVWSTLPVEDSALFADHARGFGVGTLHGGAVKVGRGPDPHLRVATDVEPATLTDGLDRLQRAWAAWAGAGTRDRPAAT